MKPYPSIRRKKSKGKIQKETILITAGPTQEAIDPVRFLSNHSTGTMGYCLAEEAARAGYKVILISGPTSLIPPEGVKFIPVITACQMYRQVMRHFASSGCLIMTAAVCDFRPDKFSRQKIKKGRTFSLKLTRTTDILSQMGKKKNNKILIGFSLESQNLKRNSKEKLIDKNLDLIIANKLYSPKAANKKQRPFGQTKIAPVLIYENGRIQKIKPCCKPQLARIIVKKVKEMQKNNK